MAKVYGGGRRFLRAQAGGEHFQNRTAQYVTKLGDEEVFVRLTVSLTAHRAGLGHPEAKT